LDAGEFIHHIEKPSDISAHNKTSV